MAGRPAKKNQNPCCPGGELLRNTEKPTENVNLLTEKYKLGFTAYNSSSFIVYLLADQIATLQEIHL